jgi:DNA-binding NarL/FixJ family response regulator
LRSYLAEASEKAMSDEASPIRILLADDHPIVREGVAALVDGQPDLSIVGQASNGREAIQQFRAQKPDITLMDIQMPVMNGLDALIAIRDEAPEARIIMLTTYAGDAQVLRAIKAGARGYLLKSSLHEELLGTIRAVHSGKKAISAEASYELAEHVSDDALTPAETRVLRLIAEGDANKEIAEKLTVSEETVKGQVRNILSKLGAKDRTQAAMIGVKRGIIQV